MHRRAFTLVEILIALILVGIGMTAVLGLILKGVRDAQEVSVWAMSTVAAEAAADGCIGAGLIGFGASGPIDLPGPLPRFECPYPIRVDVVTSGPGLPASARGGSGATTELPASDQGSLAWVRIRVYSDASDRSGDLPPLATYHVMRLFRRAP